MVLLCLAVKQNNRQWPVRWWILLPYTFDLVEGHKVQKDSFLEASQSSLGSIATLDCKRKRFKPAAGKALEVWNWVTLTRRSFTLRVGQLAPLRRRRLSGWRTLICLHVGHLMRKWICIIQKWREADWRDHRAAALWLQDDVSAQSRRRWWRSRRCCH